MGNNLTYCPTIPPVKKQQQQQQQQQQQSSDKEKPLKTDNSASRSVTISDRGSQSSRSFSSPRRNVKKKEEVNDITKSRKVKEKAPDVNPAYYKLPIANRSSRSLPRLKANRRDDMNDEDIDDQLSMKDKSSNARSTSKSIDRKVDFKSIKVDRLKSPKPTEDWIGLPNDKAKVVAELAIQKAFANPDPTFVHATPVTSVLKEKICKDDILCDDLDYFLSDNQTIYEIPLNSVGLRMLKNRTTRSKIDPWRRHGALVKLCEIGGSMPECKRRERNRQFIPIERGCKPPDPPKGKPLATIKDYMTFHH